MLVITRKPGESIIIELPDGQQFTIKIDKFSSNRHTGRIDAVRVVFDAPPAVKILRSELCQ